MLGFVMQVKFCLLFVSPKELICPHGKMDGLLQPNACRVSKHLGECMNVCVCEILHGCGCEEVTGFPVACFLISVTIVLPCFYWHNGVSVTHTHTHFWTWKSSYCLTLSSEGVRTEQTWGASHPNLLKLTKAACSVGLIMWCCQHLLSQLTLD